ncbi:hypothetical protein LCGC14_2113830 [marine sediment metagenome]|uniref:Uncharacterized protein n=1 Tax=marine sediment metagenome TaxID=412755 RepID=A0A0F9E6A7_9ZZZZ
MIRVQIHPNGQIRVQYKSTVPPEQWYTVPGTKFDPANALVLSKQLRSAVDLIEEQAQDTWRTIN